MDQHLHTRSGDVLRLRDRTRIVPRGTQPRFQGLLLLQQEPHHHAVDNASPSSGIIQRHHPQRNVEILAQPGVWSPSRRYRLSPTSAVHYTDTAPMAHHTFHPKMREEILY